MSQSRRFSALEAVTNTVVGYIVAIASQLVIFPLFGIHLPIGEHLTIGVSFTIISLVRSYILRRAFNRIRA